MNALLRHPVSDQLVRVDPNRQIATAAARVRHITLALHNATVAEGATDDLTLADLVAFKRDVERLLDALTDPSLLRGSEVDGSSPAVPMVTTEAPAAAVPSPSQLSAGSSSICDPDVDFSNTT